MARTRHLEPPCAEKGAPATWSRPALRAADHTADQTAVQTALMRGRGPVTTLPLLHALLHVILHATLADGANVARPGQNCQKSSNMGSSEHANLAEC